jgi:hypothetical protein
MCSLRLSPATPQIVHVDRIELLNFSSLSCTGPMAFLTVAAGVRPDGTGEQQRYPGGGRVGANATGAAAGSRNGPSGG